MRTPIYFRSLLFYFLVFFSLQSSGQASLRELLSYPNPGELTGSASTGRIAWVFNQRGIRNVFLSEDAGTTYKKLTNYNQDDGQQISDLQFSSDGQWLTYFRGGEPDGNWSRNEPVNPMSSPVKTYFALWSLHLPEGKPVLLSNEQEDVTPVISPDNKRVAFIRKGSVWTVPIDGSERAKQLFFTQGNCGSLQWSPDGTMLLFVASRKSHSFVGVYRDSLTPIQWIDPGFSRDLTPKWSPDGKSVVFVRLPATGGAPDSLLKQTPHPWQIRVAQINQEGSKEIWESPNTLRGSVPSTDGRFNLHWAGNHRIIFLSAQDNWPHLYSIPDSGGDPVLLTPGNFMVEYIELSPGGNQLVFSANTGNNKLDIDRRHVGVVSTNKSDMRILTNGDGIEAHPAYFGKEGIAFISSTAFRPSMPAVLKNNQIQIIGSDMLSSHYNEKEIVKPQQIIFKSLDGLEIHAQLFMKPGGENKKPAIIDIHGGPMRQMQLGWNYSGYYAAHYAVDQILVQMGFAVLSVNYRLGIGYGNDFHHPVNAGRAGISEYQDILAAGKWLADQSFVDKKRIGVYGGSYGGYLTAAALGKNSDLFAAGVDISGVHSEMPSVKYTSKVEPAPDAAKAEIAAWKSSPISYVDTWTSPVLLIHSDDDRNVNFEETIDLLNRLKKKGVYFEALAIPDETHDWIKFSNLVKIYEATVDFLNRKVKLLK